ncbi:MAG: ribosome biogenesis GTPase Der, partial [Deltaproteobacteria bacterium CG07_land_8_20_14_0_80_38_7]
MKSIVAIVGRPNVGKSSLFNRIVGWRKAIVNDAPGVTRDRHYSVADWCGREFIVVDTGGIDFAPEIDLESKVTKQSLEAISEADIVLCVFDGQVEPTSHDIELTRKLNKIGKPVIYAINKIDEAVHEGRKDCYYELGMDDFVMCSSEHGRNFDELLDKIIGYLPDEKEENKNKEALYVTVVGRPNVGKSTLINRLAGNERVIAHEMPGTTRDSIDVDIEFEGAHYVFVDTAGIRKSFKVHERVEKISAMKALRTVDRSEIICFLI